jgi:hypothetical protein
MFSLALRTEIRFQLAPRRRFFCNISPGSIVGLAATLVLVHDESNSRLIISLSSLPASLRHHVSAVIIYHYSYMLIAAAALSVPPNWTLRLQHNTLRES